MKHGEQIWTSSLCKMFMHVLCTLYHTQKCMSELLRKACEEARKGNSDIKQQVRDIGNKFLNNVEISAQEAVYILLQLPMRKSSREVIFVNTSPHEERVHLLKHIDDTRELPVRNQQRCCSAAKEL